MIFYDAGHLLCPLSTTNRPQIMKTTVLSHMVVAVTSKVKTFQVKANSCQSEIPNPGISGLFWQAAHLAPNKRPTA